MADETGFYGKRNKNNGLPGRQGSDYLDGINSAQNDFELPDYTGLSNQTGVNVPKAGRANTFSNRLRTGMQAVADTKEAMSDPDNAASTRTFQAGQHDAVSSTIQNEHNPDNAASTRAFRGMNHDVSKNTFEGQYDLDRQPTSSLFRAMRGNGKRVSGLEAVEQTDRAVNNLDYDNQQNSAHPYARGFYRGFGNAVGNYMKAEHMGAEFDRASERPDQYTEKTPLQSARAQVNELGKMNDDANREYEKTRVSYADPTADSIHKATEKYSNLLGGVAGVSLLSAVKRNLPQTGMTLSANNWSRLSHEIYQRVLDRTGNEEFAQALGWGGAAAVAQDIAPFGMFSREIPVPYQTIFEPFSRIIDSIVSDQISNGVVDEAVDRISGKQGFKKQNPD